jgi:peptidoglycan hydrolase-like protein with peptidoglycan-binding domain
VTKKTFRLRVAMIAGSVVVVAAAGIAGAAMLRSSSNSSAAGTPPSSASSSTTSTTLVTTTTTDPKALVQPPAATLPVLPPGGFGPGASGADVQAYQQRLADLHFDPGTVDGNYGEDTTYAVETLQKILGTDPNGTIGEPERVALMTFRYPDPLQADGEANRTEIDVTKQVLTLYEHHQVRLITTTSTGSGVDYCYSTPRDDPTQHICEQANTPSGRFTFKEYRDGWDKSPLGQLYNPFYFNGGIAVHGYPTVPTSPASHGCARIPMHIADYFHTLVHVGDPVYVFGGTDAKVLSSTPIETTTTTVPPPDPVPPAVPVPPTTVAPAPPTTSTSVPPTTTT